MKNLSVEDVRENNKEFVITTMSHYTNKDIKRTVTVKRGRNQRQHLIRLSKSVVGFVIIHKQ